MEHNWILDITYDPLMNPDDIIFRKCSRCNIQGFKSKSNGVIIIHLEDLKLSCEEIIIKNILE